MDVGCIVEFEGVWGIKQSGVRNSTIGRFGGGEESSWKPGWGQVSESYDAVDDGWEMGDWRLGSGGPLRAVTLDFGGGRRREDCFGNGG